MLPITGQNFSRYFEVYLEFSAVFQNFCFSCSFVPRGTVNEVVWNPALETMGEWLDVGC